MKHDIAVKNGIVIPEHELEITTSRAGGPGGQHVNKTDSRITVRFNVLASNALTFEQKERIIANLKNRITSEGDLIVHASASRSQLQNKQDALDNLARELRKGLYVAKKRMATRTPKKAKEKRLKSKTHRGTLKKLRSVKDHD